MITEKNRISIRRKKISDAKDDYNWQVDPELANLDAADPVRMSYHQFLTEFTFDLCYPSSTRHEFAIETREGAHIGNCVYYNVNKLGRETELGIMIGNRDYWNQGYGEEAVSMLLNHIFMKTEIKRVYLTTLDWNYRAHRCFTKCGFKECGKLKRDHRDFLVMAITREEWEQMRREDSQASSSDAPQQ